MLHSGARHLEGNAGVNCRPRWHRGAHLSPPSSFAALSCGASGAGCSGRACVQGLDVQRIRLFRAGERYASSASGVSSKTLLLRMLGSQKWAGPPMWMPTADPVRAQIDLRYAGDNEGELSVVVAPVLRFLDIGFNANIRIEVRSASTSRVKRPAMCSCDGREGGLQLSSFLKVKYVL